MLIINIAKDKPYARYNIYACYVYQSTHDWIVSCDVCDIFHTLPSDMFFFRTPLVLMLGISKKWIHNTYLTYAGTILLRFIGTSVFCLLYSRIACMLSLSLSLSYFENGLVVLRFDRREVGAWGRRIRKPIPRLR